MLGKGDEGRLGDGDEVDRDSPSLVSGVSTATDIAAGGAHTCAVLVGGHAACWGENDKGQLGDGTWNDNAHPTYVVNVTTAKTIACGADHSCALLNDGSVKCWGSNAYGQLGYGASPQKSAQPLDVSGITNASVVALGTYFSCALLADASVTCWGFNGFGGQLSDGTTTTRLTPVPSNALGAGAASDDAAVRLAVGGTHACVATKSGVVKCWGETRTASSGTGRRRRPTAASPPRCRASTRRRGRWRAAATTTTDTRARGFKTAR